MVVTPAIPQSEEYHNFADQRELFLGEPRIRSSGRRLVDRKPRRLPPSLWWSCSRPVSVAMFLGELFIL
ncbi:hypothetical protein GW17_00000744, partial [Ensete ventricosum]